MHFSDFSKEYAAQTEQNRKKKKLRKYIMQITIALILLFILTIIIPTKPIPKNIPNLYKASHERAIQKYGQ